MENNLNFKKQILLGYLESLITELRIYNKPKAFIDQKDTSFNGFTTQIFKQIRNLITSDFPRISNFGFVALLKNENNLLSNIINEDFILTINKFKDDQMNANTESELEKSFKNFKEETNKIYGLNF